MSEFAVTMVRSPGLTDAEVQRRIKQAFDVLWRLAEKRTTDRDNSLAAEARLVADDAKQGQHQPKWTSSEVQERGGSDNGRSVATD